MTKTGLLKALRETLDRALNPLGFRWRRMWKSPDGWYERRWDAGSERVGAAILSYHPDYKVCPFITTMLDPVAELVCPFLGYVDPDATKDFFDHNFNLSPFTKGPPGDRYCEFSVKNEDEAVEVAQEIGRVVRTAVDPWLLQHRTPAAMFELRHTPWRDAATGDPHRGMIDIALAFLASSPYEKRISAETIAGMQDWPAVEREKVERLIAELDRRREVGAGS